MSNYRLNDKAADFLKTGNVYIAGRARDGYPILVISIKNLKISNDMVMYAKQAIIFALMTIKKYMLIGGYCDSYHTFYDLDGRNPMAVSLTIIKQVIMEMGINFNQRGGQNFIYNASWGFNYTWKIMKGFVNKHTISVTKFIKKGEEKELLELVDPENWEKKFGGHMENVKEGEFWPPKNFVSDKQNIISKQDIIEKNLHSYWILDENLDGLIWPFENDITQISLNKKLYMKRLEIHRMMYNQIDLSQNEDENDECDSPISINRANGGIDLKGDSLSVNVQRTKHVSNNNCPEQHLSTQSISTNTTFQKKAKSAKAPWFSRIFGFCCTQKYTDEDKQREMIATEQKLQDIKLHYSIKINEEDGTLSTSVNKKADLETVEYFPKIPKKNRSNGDRKENHTTASNKIRWNNSYNDFTSNAANKFCKNTISVSKENA